MSKRRLHTATSTAILLVFLVCGVCPAQDSLNVTKLGGYAYWEEAFDVVVSEDIAFVATFTTGVKIVDISDPTEPQEIGSYDTPGRATDFAVTGNLLYIADDSGGLLIMDISDLSNPQYVGDCSTTGIAFGVAINGEYAYVAEADVGFGVIDISDPSQPQELMLIETPGLAWSIDIEGDYAYLADGVYGGLRVFDISSPEAPVEVGSFVTPGSCNDVKVCGNLAYVADGYIGLMVLDIADPYQPTLTSQLVLAGNCVDIDVQGDYAYLPGGQYGALWIIDISNPELPSLEGAFYGEGSERGVTVIDNLAYLASKFGGLRIIDCTIPSLPIEIGYYNPPHFLQRVATIIDYAYIASDAGVRILDTSDSTDPVEIGYYLPPYLSVSDVHLSGEWLYVATHPGWGLYILDITEPTSPIEVASCLTSDRIPGVETSGVYAYIISSYNDFYIYDIDDPTNPSEIGYCETFYVNNSLAIFEDNAYVACTRQIGPDDEGALVIIDISEPNFPSQVNRLYWDRPVTWVSVSNNYAFLSFQYGVMRIIDLADPMNPVEVSNLSLGKVYSSFVSGDHAFFACDELRVFNVADPANPYEVGYYSTSGVAEGIYVDGNLAYVADRYYFGIYDCSDAIPVAPEPGRQPMPTVFTFSAHPNPFNPTTTLTFSLPVAGNVKFEVFDIGGRRAALVGAQHAAPSMGIGESNHQWYPAGIHNLLFDGSGLSSGIYFVKLQVGDYQSSQKVVLLK
jgi:hypothetical protein